MLILRRRTGDAIMIGEDVVLEVLEISQGKVMLGIQAPPQVRILRREIAEAGAHNFAAARAVSGRAVESFLLRFRRSASK